MLQATCADHRRFYRTLQPPRGELKGMRNSKTMTKLINFIVESRRRHQEHAVSASPIDFFIPRLDTWFFIRLTIIVIICIPIFSFVLKPCIIDGGSMEPTYKRIGFTFCLRTKYLFTHPTRGDIVVLRYAHNVLLLKRVVGLPGDSVEFRNGILYLNGKPQQEPYLRYVSDWNLPPRTVKPEHIYVIGDNRSMPLKQHKFGQISIKRVYGAPLW